MDTFQKYPKVHPWNPLHQAQTRLSEGDLEEKEEQQQQQQRQHNNNSNSNSNNNNNNNNNNNHSNNNNNNNTNTTTRPLLSSQNHGFAKVVWVRKLDKFAKRPSIPSEKSGLDDFPRVSTREKNPLQKW